MTAMSWWRRLHGPAAALLLILSASAVHAQEGGRPADPPQGGVRRADRDRVQGGLSRAVRAAELGPRASADVPDIFGPGAVLNVGNIYMKVTNNGWLGNPSLATSSDPNGQWPGASGIEYLNVFSLAVGG